MLMEDRQYKAPDTTLTGTPSPRDLPSSPLPQVGCPFFEMGRAAMAP